MKPLATAEEIELAMSEYFFGLGPGWLPQLAARIARKHGARLVNHRDHGCKCGHGCSAGCPACKRHWFAGPNRGEPFNSQLGRAVMLEVGKAIVKKWNTLAK